MHGISCTRSFASGFAVLSKLGCSIKQYILCIYIIYYWGEPERAPHRRCGWARIVCTCVCMYVCMYINIVRTSVTLYGSMDISAKYSIAHSRAWATGHCNLSNCKFILGVRSISLRLLDWSRTAPYWPVEGSTCLSPALNKGKTQTTEFSSHQQRRAAETPDAREWNTKSKSVDSLCLASIEESIVR